MEDEYEDIKIQKKRAARNFWVVSVFVSVLLFYCMMHTNVFTGESVWFALLYILPALAIFDLVAFIRLIVLNLQLHSIDEEIALSNLGSDKHIPPKERRVKYFLWNMPIVILATFVLYCVFGSRFNMLGSRVDLFSEIMFTLFCAILPLLYAWFTSSAYDYKKPARVPDNKSDGSRDRLESSQDNGQDERNDERNDLQSEERRHDVFSERQFDERQEKLYKESLLKMESEKRSTETVLANYEFTKRYLQGVIKNSSNPENVSKAKELLEDWEESYNELMKG